MTFYFYRFFLLVAVKLLLYKIPLFQCPALCPCEVHRVQRAAQAFATRTRRTWLISSTCPVATVAPPWRLLLRRQLSPPETEKNTMQRKWRLRLPRWSTATMKKWLSNKNRPRLRQPRGPPHLRQTGKINRAFWPPSPSSEKTIMILSLKLHLTRNLEDFLLWQK